MDSAAGGTLRQVHEAVPNKSAQGLRSALSAHASLLDSSASVADLGMVLDDLVNRGLDRLPLPGGGDTLGRWRQLAMVAAASLPLVKLFEGHTDALAICAELGVADVCQKGTWGVFAAESRAQPLRFRGEGEDVVLDGVKSWCSGASVLSHALVTARSSNEQNHLLAVALEPRYVEIDTRQWVAVGMRSTATATLTFSGCPARVIGAANSYLDRPGFWQGAIGIAACWFGAALEIATLLGRALRTHSTEHALAHLGASVAAVGAARAAFDEAARLIDRRPDQSCRALALRLRATAEAIASEILTRSGRALGAAPYCLDAHFAALSSDLPVFLRQSHAERDLAALGELALKEDLLWTL